MTPDFRTELARLVDLYYALGGNWSPHGYTDTWNDALASARIVLATAPPTDDDLIEIARELRKTAEYLQLGCGWNKALRAIESAANLIEGDLLRRLVPPPEPPTDEELLRLYGVATPCYHVEEYKRELDFVRAALERWGR